MVDYGPSLQIKDGRYGPSIQIKDGRYGRYGPSLSDKRW